MGILINYKWDNNNDDYNVMYMAISIWQMTIMKGDIRDGINTMQIDQMKMDII